MQSDGAAGGRLVLHHMLVPACCAILRAPDRLGFLHRVGGQNRIQERVDRHVLQFRHVLPQALAVTAVRIFERHHHARAVAAHRLHRTIERKRFEIDLQRDVEPFLREILARARIEHPPCEYKRHIGIDVVELAADQHFVQATAAFEDLIRLLAAGFLGKARSDLSFRATGSRRVLVFRLRRCLRPGHRAGQQCERHGHRASESNQAVHVVFSGIPAASRGV